MNQIKNKILKTENKREKEIIKVIQKTIDKLIKLEFIDKYQIYKILKKIKKDSMKNLKNIKARKLYQNKRYSKLTENNAQKTQ